MKQTIFVIIAGLLFFSCEKKCKLPDQVIGTGEIVFNAEVIPVFANLSDELYSYGQKGYIINSENECIKNEIIFELKVSYDDGQTFEPIDFTIYTVLGKHADGGCMVRFVRDVTKNDILKKYVYTITVFQCGGCYSQDESMNWVLVPKIPEDYTVEFVVKEKKVRGNY